MTKEEFIERREVFRQQFAALCNEYIETNTIYPVGSKVEVTNPNGKRYGKVRVGIVKDTIIHNDYVQPLVFQLTADGTETRRRIVVDENVQVRVLE